MDFIVGKIYVTKKKHPCGGDCWQIVSVGADVKIKCEKCGHTVILSRDELEKRIKK